jgi:cytidine deaminase
LGGFPVFDSNLYKRFKDQIKIVERKLKIFPYFVVCNVYNRILKFRFENWNLKLLVMQKKELAISFEQYENIKELKDEDRKLLNEAMDASKSAYAPYSNFKVGAAVLLENGTIVKGSNQENAAYPSGLCAERVALFSAGAQFPDVKIKAIAVTAFLKSGSAPHPVSPCGACRQVMAEYEQLYKHNIRFIMMDADNKINIAHDVKSLLPFLFSSDSLK